MEGMSAQMSRSPLSQQHAGIQHSRVYRPTEAAYLLSYSQTARPDSFLCSNWRSCSHQLHACMPCSCTLAFTKPACSQWFILPGRLVGAIATDVLSIAAIRSRGALLPLLCPVQRALWTVC